MGPSYAADFLTGLVEGRTYRCSIRSPRILSFLCKPAFAGLFAVLVCSLLHPRVAVASAYDFLRLTTPNTLFAIDPDLAIRRIHPAAPSNVWTLGEGWGLPPLFFHSKVPGLYDRVDFFYPLGSREETLFRSRLKFGPFFDSRWSKLPPYDGYARCLTFFKGRSDLGQEYWGVFPFYGYTHRRYGVDHNFFFLFPLYYESTDDHVRTFRFLWPIVTYADNPARSTLKVWPLFGTDTIRNEYRNAFFLWPLFQKTEKHPGTEQASSFLAFPFPLYVRQTDCYSSTTSLLWPLLSYYHHYKTGHERYSFRPLFTYGTGGGVEELSILFFYSSKKDRRKVSTSSGSDGYVSVAGDEVVTQKSFLMLSTIKKIYRKGTLVYSKYRFWPFAEYTWDLAKGSRFTMPEIIPVKNDWWDLNLGRLLRLVDLRDTPITRELSTLFGLRRSTKIKAAPYITPPPKPGDDDWAEMIAGSFGNR